MTRERIGRTHRRSRSSTHFKDSQPSSAWTARQRCGQTVVASTLAILSRCSRNGKCQCRGSTTQCATRAQSIRQRRNSATRRSSRCPRTIRSTIASIRFGGCGNTAPKQTCDPMPDADEVNPRIEGALKKLLEITDRLKTGELMIGDFFINASSTDPCRMNIEMKIIRGPTQGVTDPSATAAPVTYAMADEPKLRALIERERQAAIKEERRRQEVRQKADRSVARPTPNSIHSRREWILVG